MLQQTQKLAWIARRVSMFDIRDIGRANVLFSVHLFKENSVALLDRGGEFYRRKTIDRDIAGDANRSSFKQEEAECRNKLGMYCSVLGKREKQR